MSRLDDEGDYDDDDDEDFDGDEYYDMSNQYEEQDNIRNNIDGESQSIDPEYFDYQCLSEQDILKPDFLINITKVMDKYNQSLPSNLSHDVDKIFTNTNIIKNINNNNNISDIVDSINATKGKSAIASATTTTTTTVATFKIIPKDTTGRHFQSCDICMDDGNNKSPTNNNITTTTTTTINNNNNELVKPTNLLENHLQLDKNNFNMVALNCNHAYCQRCWFNYIKTQIHQANSPQIECMSIDCHLRIPEQMIYCLLSSQEDIKLRERFMRLTITKLVQSHPRLKYCPGRDCSVIIYSPQFNDIPIDKVEANYSESSTNISRKVICNSCQTMFCFNCSLSYHAPTDCATIKKWLKKCEDDSETCHYISAHTKPCPKCSIAIEKNGGCNHMQCFSCRYEFCWICQGDWKSHGSAYYECSRYQANSETTMNSNGSSWSKAYELLKKYLFYYERWENHAKSLKLEQETLARIKQRIHSNVMANKGTWIDWHYLLDAAQLLSRCRHTLQYTYPYAFYLEAGPRKQLFEYQQAQLEAEIENLSWEIERAENTNRGHIENQMNTAEKWRITLLNDFYK